ncbi:glycosyltransferase family 2 protein [Alkalicoccobacillus murimartini]|uniref:Glucosyl-3-phosphoglycerate synthase n=1 Tax=Alkalicoccobacillus murimartini TaxID=171685 RepID=A0ABT9YN56_9BACI|nr:glycosyltransferase family 2 protein [Alkalicoccobacillus murimartini]MDQ0208921.1 glycosyltransferase involved in cell wall biosynthesis [Alkalicoccobacillus murimartini]
MTRVSIVIPAYNEQDRLANTINAVRSLPFQHELICVNDGSVDHTAEIAEELADVCIHLPKNQGKGHALQAGWKQAKGMYILCLDADLQDTASEAAVLLEPVMNKRADLTISKMPQRGNGGRGLVKHRVQKEIHRHTGVWLDAPLSGQRAFQRQWLRLLLSRSYSGYGIETMMCLHMLKGGARLLEVESTMRHREMGRYLPGMMHRFKQWRHIEKQLRGETV